MNEDYTTGILLTMLGLVLSIITFPSPLWTGFFCFVMGFGVANLYSTYEYRKLPPADESDD